MPLRNALTMVLTSSTPLRFMDLGALKPRWGRLSRNLASREKNLWSQLRFSRLVKALMTASFQENTSWKQ